MGTTCTLGAISWYSCVMHTCSRSEIVLLEFYARIFVTCDEMVLLLVSMILFAYVKLLMSDVPGHRTKHCIVDGVDPIPSQNLHCLNITASRTRFLHECK